MQTDCNIDTRLFNQIIEMLMNTNGRNSDAAGTHIHQLLRSQDFKRSVHFIPVVERLAHAHVHNVGYLIALINGHELIEDFACCQVSMKANGSGGAKPASIAASGLRRHTNGQTVFIRYNGGFYNAAAIEFKQIFFCSVFRNLHI